MKVAVLGSRGYPSTYGGFETFVRYLAPWLADRGHEVTVYGRGGPGPRARAVDGVQVVDTVGLDRKATGTTTYGLTAAVDALRRRPDVVLALNVANGPALPLLKARGIPVVMNVDGIEWERGKWGSLARRAFRLGARMSARFADVLVADSMEVGRVWRQEFGVEPVHIPYGADLIEQVPARRVKEAGLVPGEYAIAVARLVPENHVEVFLDALDRLNGAVHGVVVGTANYDNPIESRLRAMAATGRVTWLGHVEDPDLLDELWSHAAVYFHGHSVGGTNPALLQALGNACAVVAVDTPFNREVLGPRATLVPPDPEAVGNRLRQLCVDVDLRAEVAAEGPAIIRERYTWQSVLEAYERLLEDTGSRRRR